MSVTHVTKLRRLRTLQRLGFMSPSPVGEAALLADLKADPALSPTIELVRQTLNYLAEHGLVALITHQGSEWVAAIITDAGIAWLDSPLDNGLAIYTLVDQPPRSANRLGRVSSIDALPLEAKFWLEAELIKGGFTGYTKLTSELNKQGYSVTKSALGRYAKKLKDQFEADRSTTRRRLLGAQYKVQALGDEIEVNQVLRGMAQDELLSMFLAGDALDAKTLKRMVDMSRSLSSDAMKAEEYRIRKEAREQAFNEAADRVVEAAESQGLDKEQVHFWRQEVMRGL